MRHPATLKTMPIPANYYLPPIFIVNESNGTIKLTINSILFIKDKNKYSKWPPGNRMSINWHAQLVNGFDLILVIMATGKYDMSCNSDKQYNLISLNYEANLSCKQYYVYF